MENRIGFVGGAGIGLGGGHRRSRVCGRVWKQRAEWNGGSGGGEGGTPDRNQRRRRDAVVVWWRNGCSENHEALRLARGTGKEVHCLIVGGQGIEPVPAGVRVHCLGTNVAVAAGMIQVCLKTGAREIFFVGSDILRSQELPVLALNRHGILVHRVIRKPMQVPLLASAVGLPLVSEQLENGQYIEYNDDDGQLKAELQKDNRSVSEKFKDFIYNNIASSVMAVISTEALLFGLGLGKKGSAVAAATSWVLKDGLGYMGKVLYGYLAGKQFDSDPKSWRVSSDTVEDLGGVLELLTPLFPGNFLLLASIANAMKGVAGMTGTATRHAIYKSLALRENQGDIATKGESQGVTCKMVGLGLGIGVSSIIGQNYATLLAAYSAFAVIHLGGNWQSMKCVQFSTINRQRGSLVMEAFLDNKSLPTPYDVSHDEKVMLPPWRQFNGHVILGAKISEAMPKREMLEEARQIFSKSKYMATVREGKMYVVFNKNAASQDVLSSYLMSHRYKRNGGDLKEAFIFANKNMSKFQSAVHKAGWRTESSMFLFNVSKNRASW